MWRPDQTYDDLPPLPPAGDIETHAVLKATIRARDTLARFDASAQHLPNPTVLINAIPLLEAQASSEIENIVTTTDELFTAAQIDATASPAAREALRYRTALASGFDRLDRRPLDTDAIARICSIIRGHEVVVRTDEVFIGDPATHARTYTPPRRPADHLDAWVSFVNEPTALDPLVQMALAHYQLEAIHPFTDGNGRTGRIVNVLMLCASGLLRLPLLYLSRYVIEHKDDYYRLLLAVTADQSWEEWILFMIDGVRETAERMLALVGRITELEHALMGTLRRTIGSPNADLAATLMEQPYARVRDVIDRCAVSRPTATKWLRALTEAGVLQRIRVGREDLYVNLELMVALREG